jgi:hypothetical protein
MEEIDFLEAAIICKNCDLNYEQLPDMTIRNITTIKEMLAQDNNSGKLDFFLLRKNTNKMQLCNRIYYFKVFLKAQHISSGTPLFIRSSKLYLQPLVYMPIW